MTIRKEIEEELLQWQSSRPSEGCGKLLSLITNARRDSILSWFEANDIFRTLFESSKDIVDGNWLFSLINHWSYLWIEAREEYSWNDSQHFANAILRLSSRYHEVTNYHLPMACVDLVCCYAEIIQFNAVRQYIKDRSEYRDSINGLLRDLEGYRTIRQWEDYSNSYVEQRDALINFISANQ